MNKFIPVFVSVLATGCCSAGDCLRAFSPLHTEGDATKVVQAAIDDCFRAGGGVVRLCKGKWKLEDFASGAM